MPVAVAVPAFLAGALVSLATSWVLVSRLERVGERLGLSEALLGIVAALAADAPEVTAAVTAVAGGQQRLGAGVVIGSNVFNLAALLGLGAVVAGRIRLHRKVVILSGAVAMAVAFVCLAVVAGFLPPLAGCVLGLVIVALYAIVLAGPQAAARFPLPRAWIGWLRSAVAEEELELEEAIRPEPARRKDYAAAAGSLIVVIVASVTMERAASALGTRFAVPEIVVGGLVLAAVTSLPNAVAAVYLAARGRGAATLSIALNSNTLNVAIGLLIPAVVIGFGHPASQTTLIAGWYLGLTFAVLAFAYADRGIRREVGVLIIAAYVAFAVSLAVPGHAARLQFWIAGGVTVAIMVVFGIRLLARRGQPGGTEISPASPARTGNGQAFVSWLPQPSAGRQSLLPGWPVRRIWALGVALSVIVAATDAALGHRAVLIGLLIIGPCCVLLTGRWVPTALTGLWVIGLAILLGVPDGIWGTSSQLAFLGAVTAVAAACTLAAAIIQARERSRFR
jgi:cation:H+ antiporter